MNDLEKIKQKIELLEKEYNSLVMILSSKCFKITHKPSLREEHSNFNLDFSVSIIDKKLLPTEFFTSYRKWYSTSKAIIETNYDSESIEEYLLEYEIISKACSDTHISKEVQERIETSLKRQIDILLSLPSYLEGKYYSLELSIATTLMGDELKEARLLFSKKFYRPAGAIAGVILERHLKMRLDNNNPKIKYGEKATLGQLIAKVEENKLFEDSSILKLKYLNNIRIKCDHDKSIELKESEVTDLIDYTDRFIHFLE